MFKKFVFLSLSILLMVSANGQSIDEAYKQLMYGKNQDAINSINKIIQADPENLANLLNKYCIYIMAGRTKEATETLNEIIIADNKSLEGKTADFILQLNNGADFNVLTPEIDKLFRKNKGVRATLSRAIGINFMYGIPKNLPKSIAYLRSSIDEYGDKSVTARILLGDAYFSKPDAGNAVTNYEYAKELDKKNATSPYKIGKAYLLARNYEFGIPSFKEAIQMDPNYALPWKDLGKYYYDINKFSDAKINYTKYLSMVKPTIDEKVQFGNILFLNKDFEEATTLLEETSSEDKTRKYLQRLLGYSYFELGQNQKALEKLQYFMNHHDTTKIISSDFEYLGKIYKALGQDSLYRVSYLSAFSLDSTKATLLKEIADTLYVHGKYAEAGTYYYAVAKSTNLAVDYYYATKSDYLGSNYTRGDSAAAGIILKLPEDATGYLWRARHNAIIDTLNTGLAVPFYDKVIEIHLKAEDRSKVMKELMEAIDWLTVFYIKKGDLAKANETNEKGLEIDSNNPKVLERLNYLESQKK